MDSRGLKIRGLEVEYKIENQTIRAIDSIDLDIPEGSVTGIAGESGSGKSTLALSILRLIEPPGRIVGGEILFGGKDLLSHGESSMREIRGRRISFIPQNPGTALDPTMTIGNHLLETIQQHYEINRQESVDRAKQALERARLPSPLKAMEKYPHELSGGMNQRVMIALALACEAEVMIADEPTSALDVSTQAKILSLLRALNEQVGTTIVLITHDLAVVAQTCHLVAILYAGKVMEFGEVRALFNDPAHPYSRGLLGAVPRLGKKSLPIPIEGDLTISSRPSIGCVFHPRCPRVMEICTTNEPPSSHLNGDRLSYCYLHDE